MRGPRSLLTLGILAIIMSGVVMGVGVFGMKDRLEGRDLQMVYFQSPIYLTEFNFKGESVSAEVLSPADRVGAAPPTAVSSDTPLDAAIGADTWVLRYTFRGETVEFPILDPADARLFPVATDDDRLGLLEDWFKVLPMVTGARTAIEAAEGVASGDIPGRLIIAARYESPELRPQWAEVQRQNWIYRIAEFNAAEDTAPGEPAIALVEKTYRELDVLHTPGTRTPEELIPTPEERERDLWQHYAMQEVTPAPFFRAKDRNLDAALEAMGWTWPVSLGGGFGIVISIILIGLGLKTKPELAA